MRINRLFAGVLLTIMTLTLLTGNLWARMDVGKDSQIKSNPELSTAPSHCVAGHRVGRMDLAVNNNGTFGTNYSGGQLVDCFTGQEVRSCEYPKGSHISYLYGAAFWIGAVSGRDTLVSVGHDGWSFGGEMFPDAPPFGDMIYRSITDPDAPEYEDAISEEDYISVYTDTLTTGLDPDFFGRPHIPLGIEVTEGSYAWSYSYAEDFVLFDYQIRNIGSNLLQNVYMGVYVDADVAFDAAGPTGSQDDICGFIEAFPATYGNCDFLDTVNIAFIADDNGDYDFIPTGQTEPKLAPHVTATRIVRTPAESLDVSFNWWIGNGNPSLDFGPRERPGMGRWQEEWRDFRTGGMGTPEGDANKYYTMRNREFDYDQIYTASIQISDTLWQYPDQERARDFADGYDTRYLLSFGPFDINPGQTLPVSFAYLAGENLHTLEENAEMFLPDAPEQYYSNLDFSDLALNAKWASWIYDNPGVDTDGDEYYGKFRECCDTSIQGDETLIVCDTFWYEGDGVPDLRGASPPPAPAIWVSRPDVSTIRVRWNGLRSETTKDVFARVLDFEGYRVYLASDDRAASYSVIQSYDRENYNKLVYNASATDVSKRWELLEVPFSIESLRCLYGDSCNDLQFDPTIYTVSNPYTHPDFPESLFVFEAQDYNASVLGDINSTGIVKIYPEQEYPTSLMPDSAEAEELTEDGYLKYFEYEFVIENKLPTVPYYVNVTAFDYGSPQSGLASLETSVTAGAKKIYPLSSWEDVQSEDLEIFIYPNPYRLDATYRERGFEGRVDIDRPPDRTRELHFANLPPKCTIRIYTLDGDLVREIEHDQVAGTGEDTHESWNLITRNTQLIVSGIYYWVVETDTGDTQIGKLVVIM